jgi:hypothetical protein
LELEFSESMAGAPAAENDDPDPDSIATHKKRKPPECGHCCGRGL